MWLGPGPGNLSQKVYDITHKKKQTFCFHCRLEELQHLFKGLNSSLAQSLTSYELQSGVKIVAHAGYLGTIHSYTGSKHVKI